MNDQNQSVKGASVLVNKSLIQPTQDGFKADLEKIKLEPGDAGDGDHCQAEKDRQKKDNHNKSEKDKNISVLKNILQSRDGVDLT